MFNEVLKSRFYIILLILISIVFILLIYPHFSQIGTDSSLYAIMGKNLIEGNGLTLWGVPHTIFSPFLPFIIGIFYKLVNNLELSAHLATFFFAISSIPALYYLIKIITKKNSTALVGAAFLTFNGYIVWQYSVIPTPQILVGFLSILTFVSLLKISNLEDKLTNSNIIWSFCAGVIVGLSYLTRPEYFIIIFFVLGLTYLFNRKNIKPKLLLLVLILIMSGFLFVSLPYIFFLHSNLDYWTISGRGSEMLLQLSGENYESINTIGGENNFNNALISAPDISNDTPIYLLNNYLSILKDFFDSLQRIEYNFLKAFGIIGIAFFTIGIRSVILFKQYKNIAISGILMTPVIAIAFFQGGSMNYLIQFLYIFIIFISIGFMKLHDYLRFNITNKKISSLLITIIFLFTSLYFFSPVLKNYLFLPADYQPKEFKLMGLWMKDNIKNIENEFVMSRKPDVSFYSGAEWQLIPSDINILNLSSFMYKNDIKYLIIDERTLLKEQKEFVSSIVDKKYIKNLLFLKEFEYEKKSILLFSTK